METDFVSSVPGEEQETPFQLRVGIAGQDGEEIGRSVTRLCAEGLHFVQKLPTGRYICVYECGLQFTEYHELVIMAGAGARSNMKKR